MRKVGVALLLVGVGLAVVGIIVGRTAVTIDGGADFCGYPLYRPHVFEQPIDACREVIQDWAILTFVVLTAGACSFSGGVLTMALSSVRRNRSIRTADLEAS
ncbi:hypothetical protein IA539_22635 [Gordonia sp. zg691]|uniref:hypothetical protein n=1 Tax=Gordonia jinghuaiqii TaxID=2758710 RepID=UPI0016627B36|nr:hypothetical protein [Gordonia jinghuaiqii]MBD0863972.1 hypothetical protein [Gordonia jinghuaiqii]